MAFPTFLFDSGVGSDTQASGAGPSTAIFGTSNASTNGSGTIVTLPAGTVLTGVAVDGSHCIYLNDSVAGHRQFSDISGSSGSGGATPQVTVNNAVGVSLTNTSWAIGGQRRTISGSSRLFENNAASGDLMPGWTAQLAAGFVDTITSLITFRRAGNTSQGPIRLIGPGSGTKPIINFNYDGNGFAISNNFWQLDYLQLESTSTKTTGAAISAGGSVYGPHLKRITATTSGTNKWNFGFTSLLSAVVESCIIGNTANDGILGDSGSTAVRGPTISGCNIFSTANRGINIISNPWFGVMVTDNIITGCNGAAILFNNARSGDNLGSCSLFARNSCDANAGDGLRIIFSNESLFGMVIENNDFSNSTGGYGINFTLATLAILAAYGVVIRNNNLYNNFSGKYNPAGLNSYDELLLDPGFAGGGNYAVGANLKAVGFPLINIGASTRSYMDIGAAQRQEPAAGGGSGGGSSIFGG